MNKRGIAEWVNQDKIRQILVSFVMPKTPRQVEKERKINKLKLKPFLERGLLECLNPDVRKGRFYVITNKARRLLKLSMSKKDSNKNWGLIGWIVASAMQRTVILKAMDTFKRTSEEIRERASQSNPSLSRISTKDILKQLVNRDLVETELNERKRYYWISEKGLNIKSNLKL